MLQQICDALGSSSHLCPPRPSPGFAASTLPASAVTYTLRKENTCLILRPKRPERDYQVWDEAKGNKPREETKQLHDVRDGEGNRDPTSNPWDHLEQNVFFSLCLIHSSFQVRGAGQFSQLN